MLRSVACLVRSVVIAYLGSKPGPALRWDLGNADAWAEFLDYASAVPDIPSMVALFARASFGVGPRLLRRLDRWPAVAAETGQHGLRDRLLRGG